MNSPKASYTTDEEDVFYDSSDDFESESNSDQDSDSSNVSYTTEEDVFYDSSELQNIELLPHQKQVIKYLVAKCRKQHGLLVNHYQGTGKTITGVFFLQNYPRYKKTIVAPAALKSMWEKACRDQKLVNDMYFVTYEYLDDLFKRYDEDDDEERKKLRNIQNVFKDAVLICDEVHNLIPTLEFMHEMSSLLLRDIPFTVSKKERRNLTQVNEETLKERKKLKAFLDLFMSSKRVLLMTGTPVVKDAHDIRWLINIAAGKQVVPYNINDFNKQYLYKREYITWYKKALPLLQIFGLGHIDIKYITEFETEIKNTIQTVFRTITGNIVADQTIRWFITESIMDTLQKARDKYWVESLDVKKVDWGKYVSFYKYNNLDYYPSMNVSQKSVNYTDYQLQLLTRISDMNLTAEELVYFGVADNEDDALLFKPDEMYTSDNKLWRIVGNMGPYPNKFRHILDDYLQHKTSTMVYSNYESGVSLFSKFLTENKVKHVVFTPNLTSSEKERILDDYKNQHIKMLLLHPAFFEGFSIKGVRRFHILEPVEKYHIKEQLYTRVVRFKSHDHLPKNDRSVEIIQWYCTLSNLENKVKQLKLQIQNNTYDLKNLSFKGSVDEVVMNKSDDLEGKLNQMSHVLKQVSIEENNVLLNLNDECCIYGDHCQTGLKKCRESN